MRFTPVSYIYHIYRITDLHTFISNDGKISSLLLAFLPALLPGQTGWRQEVTSIIESQPAFATITAQMFCTRTYKWGNKTIPELRKNKLHMKKKKKLLDNRMSVVHKLTSFSKMLVVNLLAFLHAAFLFWWRTVRLLYHLTWLSPCPSHYIVEQCYSTPDL